MLYYSKILVTSLIRLVDVPEVPGTRGEGGGETSLGRLVLLDFSGTSG